MRDWRLKRNGVPAMQNVQKVQPSIGFGLGRLHHVLSGAERERIVLGAIDAGIEHFDVAAAYGDGLCEAEAGRLL
jgi:aryl-alcohol dehydrogenase-like predicted oxidoreductase